MLTCADLGFKHSFFILFRTFCNFRIYKITRAQVVICPDIVAIPTKEHMNIIGFLCNFFRDFGKVF